MRKSVYVTECESSLYSLFLFLFDCVVSIVVRIFYAIITSFVYQLVKRDFKIKSLINQLNYKLELSHKEYLKFKIEIFLQLKNSEKKKSPKIDKFYKYKLKILKNSI